MEAPQTTCKHFCSGLALQLLLEKVAFSPDGPGKGSSFLRGAPQPTLGSTSLAVPPDHVRVVIVFPRGSRWLHGPGRKQLKNLDEDSMGLRSKLWNI